MDITQRDLIMQRWGVVQRELMPELRSEIGPLTSKPEKVIHTLKWVRILHNDFNSNLVRGFDILRPIAVVLDRRLSGGTTGRFVGWSNRSLIYPPD